MSKTQALGIDLGTSNCALAITDSQSTNIFGITQIAGTNRVEEKNTFASALYMPAPNQFPPDGVQLPWSTAQESFIVGNFARDIGAQVPGRLVTSAKSWLANPHNDPCKALLPWESDCVEKKFSPMEATSLYLRHLKASYENICKAQDLDANLENTQVVLTVPASFDEAARKLTYRAAQDAAWGDEVILLEEPQAAFYSWLGMAQSQWRDQVKPGDIILICDIGGGTTDFSLVAVSDQDGNLVLQRISVGKHILLGGDNMDLALAFGLRQQLAEEGKKIDNQQFLTLFNMSRKAKENLLENSESDSITVSVPSRGSGLFAGTVSTKLTRKMVQATILEGFFPLIAKNELPQERESVGLQELGLAYETDAVISKHLSAFLTNSCKNVLSSPELTALVNQSQDRLAQNIIRPDAVLFNGGVFRSQLLRERMKDLLKSWSPEYTIRELQGIDLDLAVARGASIYGYTKISGKGIRIRSGIARSYYLGIEKPTLAIPGYTPPVKALCVANQGMEEGQERILDKKEFGLVTGATVNFRFFSAADRAGDQVGDVLENADQELEETTRLEMTLPQLEGFGERAVVPVKLHAVLNELGILQLWMQHTQSQKRWELDFKVRTE